MYVSSSWAVILNVSSVYQDNVHHERRRKSETRYILMGKIIDIILPYHVRILVQSAYARISWTPLIQSRVYGLFKR